MTAMVFAVSRHDLYIGAALICPDTRYFSVTVSGITTIYRRAIPAQAWDAISAELGEAVGRQLPQTSAIARLICNHEPSTYRVECVAQPPVKAGTSAQVEAHLDRLLTDVCAATTHAGPSGNRRQGA
jgi:hypothetical protein